MLWSASFLKNIAQQNYTKYKHSFHKSLRTAIENVGLNPPAGEVRFCILKFTEFYGFWLTFESKRKYHSLMSFLSELECTNEF